MLLRGRRGAPPPTSRRRTLLFNFRPIYLLITHSLSYSHTYASLTHYALLYICVLGVKQYILPTGRMYTAFLWYSSGIPLASLWCSLRDSRGTMRSAKGSDVRLASP